MYASWFTYFGPYFPLYCYLSPSQYVPICMDSLWNATTWNDPYLCNSSLEPAHLHLCADANKRCITSQTTNNLQGQSIMTLNCLPYMNVSVFHNVQEKLGQLHNIFCFAQCSANLHCDFSASRSSHVCDAYKTRHTMDEAWLALKSTAS